MEFNVSPYSGTHCDAAKKKTMHAIQFIKQFKASCYENNIEQHMVTESWVYSISAFLQSVGCCDNTRICNYTTLEPNIVSNNVIDSWIFVELAVMNMRIREGRVSIFRSRFVKLKGHSSRCPLHLRHTQETR